MTDIIYFSNELDSNGELHFKRVQQEAAFNAASLQIQRIIHDDPPRNDPTLAEFYAPDISATADEECYEAGDDD